MQKLFNNILIPVDFSSQSKTAIEKAIDIANHYRCGVHLLHVITASAFSSISNRSSYMPYDNMENETELEFEMDKLCKSINQSSVNIAVAKWSILAGSWDEVIIDSIIQKNIDLVLIGLETDCNGKRKMVLNPDKIATQANIPVITLPLDRRLIRLHSIVIPVTDFLPVRKLMYGMYLAQEYDARIMLLGITNNSIADEVTYYMNRSRELVLDNDQFTVQQDYVKAQNIAKAVYQYAIEKYADLIILNPGSQTKMPGLFSSLLGNTIQRFSIPPVLTVNPLRDFLVRKM